MEHRSIKWSHTIESKRIYVPVCCLTWEFFQMWHLHLQGGSFSVPSAFVINVTWGWLNLSSKCFLFLCSHFSVPSVLRSIFQACDTCCRKCQRGNGVWYLEIRRCYVTAICQQTYFMFALGHSQEQTKRWKSLSSITFFWNAGDER